jgi:hypothetical protein
MSKAELLIAKKIEPTQIGDIYPAMRFAAAAVFYFEGDSAMSYLLCGFAPTYGEAERIVLRETEKLREYLDNGTYCVGAWHEIVRTRKDLDSFRITPIKRQGG